MNMGRLSYDSMPPLAVPYRFFLTAPLFMVVVGLLLLFAPPAELATRWSGVMLAVTHGITLGFMLMIMLGALFQILPVVTGVTLPKADKLSMVVHFFLVVGAGALLGGFVLTNPTLLLIGGVALAITFVTFLSALFKRLPKMPNAPTSWAIRLAAISLLITIALGFGFVGGWFDPTWFPGFRLWTNIHILWGLVGWTLLLVMGVSFQIIPMFYVAPEYPKWVTHYLPPLVFVQLMLISILPAHPIISNALLLTLAGTTASYAICTLYLLAKRKRKSKDITIQFWQAAMVNYLLGVIIFGIVIFYQGAWLAQLQTLLATVIIVGFVLTLITGMLLKIVPFLVWLHLQQSWMKHPAIRMPLTNMQQVIPNKTGKTQYMLFVSLYLPVYALMAGFQPLWLVKLTAIQLVTCYGYLFWQLLKAKQLSNRLTAQMNEQARDYGQAEPGYS